MRYWYAAFCIVFALAFAGRAEATNTACYDWNCNDSTHVCTFDAGCTTITTGSIFLYHWDYGDGTYDNTTTQYAMHTFSTAYPTVTLTVFLFGGTEPVQGCQIVVWNQVGPPLATYGRCP